jgi:hypothetical protein
VLRMKIDHSFVNAKGLRCLLLVVFFIAWHSAFAQPAVDFTPNGMQPGLQWGIEGNDSCLACHSGNQVDATFMPHSTWSGSMMSNAARDPMFWAALDIANRDVPGVGDYCLRCHAPNAWLAGRVRKDGQGGTVNGTNGCEMQGDQDDFDGKSNDYSGIGCHFCHRVKETGPAGQPTLRFNANFWLDDALSCNVDGETYGGPCRRGPYVYPDNPPAGQAARPPHGHQFDRSYSQSAFCGTCHDVSAPDTSNGPLKTLILNNGTDTGLAFPLDRTYTEWLNSEYSAAFFRNGVEDRGPASGGSFGQTCQSCHMRTSHSPQARACTKNVPGSRTGNLSVHEFAGSNVFMTQVIKAVYGVALGRESAFDQTVSFIRDNLQNRSATIQVTTQPLLASSNTLNATVKVTNLTGHKLPAGYAEGRRIWVNLVARDANNAVIFESGAYDASSANLVEDTQVKIYEAVPGVWQRFGNTGVCVTKENATNRKLFNLVLNNCIAKDNRIPPLGFTGGNNPEIRPVNYTYPETQPGSGQLVNFDTTNYTIPVPLGAARPITVTAVLKHQVMSKAYAEFLRDEAISSNIPSENTMCNRTGEVGPRTLSRGQFMYNLWNTNGKSMPENMVAASAVSSASALSKDL